IEPPTAEPIPETRIVVRAPRPKRTRPAKSRPRKTALAKAMKAIEAVAAEAPSWSRRYRPDHVSIDPSTRNANRTATAGTQSAGDRRSAEIENVVSVPSGARSRGAVRAFQTDVAARTTAANVRPSRKSRPAARIRPADAAPVTPPSA